VVIFLIGVIAGETIPVLLTTYQEKELLTRWKKTFSVISQITVSLNDNGNNSSINWGLVPPLTFKNYYKQNLNVLGDALAPAFFAPTFHPYKNTSVSFGITDTYALILADGVTLYFNSMLSNCGFPSGTLANMCGYIIVDVNGKNGPNMIGKDFFQIIIAKPNGYYIAVPAGGNGSAGTCVAGSNSVDSLGCSAKALLAKTPADMP